MSTNRQKNFNNNLLSACHLCNSMNSFTIGMPAFRCLTMRMIALKNKEMFKNSPPLSPTRLRIPIKITNNIKKSSNDTKMIMKDCRKS
jgi:hypothetical protein